MADTDVYRRQLEAVCNNASVALFIMDDRQHCTYMNPAAEQLTGYTFEEVQGRPLHDVIHHTRPDGSHYPLEECPIDRAFPDRNKVRGEDVFIHKDGSFYPVAFTASPIREDGLSVGTIIEVQDITDRKRTEQALQESERRLREVLAAGRVMTFEWTVATDVVLRSDLAGDMLGLGHRAVHDSGRAFFATVHPEDRERFKRVVSTVGEQSNHRYMTEYRVVRPDGSTLWIHETAQGTLDAEGRLKSLAGVMVDVTEVKRLERALQHQVERLAEADRKKNEFIATLAHELRNPLAPIQNGLQIMRLADGENAAITKAREMMERQLAHLVRLVDDLLDVSRISRGKIELKRERVSLKGVIDSAVEASRPVIESGRHELLIDLPEGSALLDGDPTRLAQVLSNLLNNAANYSPNGGRIELSAAVASGQVVIRVRDNGSGIAREMLPHIFELFVQGPRALGHAHGGLGIGLSLVRKLVEMHGGTVEAESPGEGRGSTFTVRLPVASPPTGQNESHPARRRPRVVDNGPSRRVLVVDDNEDSAQSLARFLAMSGHETRVAYCGPVALNTAHEFRPDLVLLDIGMPDMDGYDVCKRLRASALGSRLTIVAVTGWGTQADRERTRAAGFDHHLVKPVDPDQLQAVFRAVAENIGERRAEAGLA